MDASTLAASDNSPKRPCAQAHELHGARLPDDAVSSAQFCLRTAAAASQAPAEAAQDAAKSIPLLPSGTLVSGLPAALMSHCQVHPLVVTHAQHIMCMVHSMGYAVH